MLVKSLFVFCIPAVLLKVVQTQCIGAPLIAGETLLPSNMAAELMTPVFGRVVGANIIIDTSAPEPSGVSIFSEDVIIEGTVLVTGNLPFLGTVALEGVVPATGSSAVAYECGTGNIGIADTPPVPVSVIPPNVSSLGMAGSINRLARF
ncbi:unnamed protein product [Arctia plantaginis]|uniref:Uncharacterized protein n=1 Tax=Arctia plantaginis TaxID=874455 RepID=A0A8S0YWX8_ARCPL|nr:unnamed protein product [Arctia plantaginis]CAB3247423.1 unnamed protein product [Arctia plantaginis]